MLNRRTLVAAAATLLWLTAAGPAAADCEPAGPIEEALPAAPVAFVGTVAALDGPIATFAVSEVWAGEVADVVTVRGLSDAAAAGFTEDDRQWSHGELYLVVPWVDGGALRDSICTATTKWRPELEDLRPADARIVSIQGTGDAAPSVALILVATAVVIAGASVLAFRRR
jgi:hypothetical protein